MRRALLWLVGGALFAFSAYVGYAGFQISHVLDTILRVGSPIAQGEGQPAALRPEDIGYVGDPRAAFGYAFETVDLASDLGPMPAWLIQPEAPSAKRWAIVVHGIGGRRENGYRFLPTLRAAGLPVLMISYRNDEGAPPAPDGLYSLGLAEWRDLEAAVTLAGLRGADEIVLVAESMGGGIVGQFLRRSQMAGRVKAVVLDAPMLDLPATLSALVGRLGVPLPATVARTALWLASSSYPIRLEDAVVTDDFVNFAGPLFLSHGTADRIVPVSTSDRLAELRTRPTKYVRTRADHILSWKENPESYDDQLSAFLSTVY